MDGCVCMFIGSIKIYTVSDAHSPHTLEWKIGKKLWIGSVQE